MRRAPPKCKSGERDRRVALVEGDMYNARHVLLTETRIHTLGEGFLWLLEARG